MTDPFAGMTRPRAARAARFLAVLDAGPVTDRGGFATRALVVAAGEAPDRATTLQTATKLLNELAALGLVTIKQHGRRTVRIARPDAPELGPDVAALHGQPFVPDDDELGEPGRPGRVAARLERRLPELVADATAAAVGAVIDTLIATVAAALGYEPAGDAGELRAALELADADVARLHDELRTERALVHEARAELNGAIGARVKIETVTSLRADVVAESFRTIVRDALAAGWSLHPTNGGHFALRHPRATSPAFLSATPSARSAAVGLRRDIRAAIRADRNGSGATGTDLR